MAAKFPGVDVTGPSRPRPNERAAKLTRPRDANLRFIGRIRTPWRSREACPPQGRIDGPECSLVLDPVWHDALGGIEAYDTIEVLYWLDRSRRDLIRQSDKSDRVTVGTFALRAPARPNPIGTAMVRLLHVQNGVVFVRGLDCLDGTPLLDIKPDRCAFCPKARPRPGDDPVA